MERDERRNREPKPEQLGDAVHALTATAEPEAGARSAIAETCDAVIETINDLKRSLIGTAANATDTLSGQRNALVSRMNNAAPSTTGLKQGTTQVVDAVRRRPRVLSRMLSVAGAIAVGVACRRVATRTRRSRLMRWRRH